MTKSVKEKHRLSLIRKIRETDFEFFDPDSVKLKLCYVQYHGRSEIEKHHYREFLTNTNFKDKLKELLFPIVRHLNSFDFYINMDFTTYRGIKDYCFVMELQDKNRTPIGDILFHNPKRPAIFIEAEEGEDPSDPKTAINSLVKIVNTLSSVDVSVKVHFHHGQHCFRENLKLAKIANLDKHFLFLHDFIMNIDEKYNFKLLSKMTEVKFFNTYYNIAYGISYQIKPIFDSKSSNSFRNKSNYIHPSYPLMHNQYCLVKSFIDYGILPEELKDDYQDLTLEQIFEHANLMKY